MSALARELQERPSLRRLILKPCKITLKGTPRGASQAMTQASPLTVSFDRDSAGACRRDGHL
jgi:hypothetical protein